MEDVAECHLALGITYPWLYAQHSQLPDLTTCDRYCERWSTFRIDRLRQRIALHQPKVVLFYSFSYLRYWEAIVGAPLQPILADTMYARHHNNCLYLVLKHPNTRGVTSEYFHEAGRYLRRGVRPIFGGLVEHEKTICLRTPENVVRTRSHGL